MLKSSFLKHLTTKIAQALPTELHTLQKDFEKKCRMILNKAFMQFDIVTREEFETQTKVLVRTRKKLDALQEQVQTLERMMNQSNKPPHDAC